MTVIRTKIRDGVTLEILPAEPGHPVEHRILQIDEGFRREAMNPGESVEKVLREVKEGKR